MDLFSKVKMVSLKAGMNLIQTVTTVAHDIGISSSFVPKKPIDDFLSRFNSVLQILDQLANMENSNSAEAEKSLNESKVRDHLREMLRHLQNEDEQWIHSHGEKTDDEIRDHPCLEIFLQNHVMEKLCTRAKKDKPRGCLPLVLALATSILRVLRYPLLPHQTVHKSLCQLIVNAAAISGKYTALIKNLPDQKNVIQAYIKKIDSNLVALIGALWKRISENPDLLTFFRFVDTRDGAKMKQHLDAIMCLIPLMGKTKVGIQAKEALLIAVSMHDRRVDRFILAETNLPRNIVNELVKKYSACISIASTLTPIIPAVVGVKRDEIITTSPTSNNGSGSNHGHNIQGGGNNNSNNHSNTLTTENSTKLSSITAFLKVLKFCSAFVATASDIGGSEDLDGLINIEEDPSCASLQSTVCENFRQYFLIECVRPSLLENGEQHVLIAQSLFRYMLLDFSPSSSNRNNGETSIPTPITTGARLLCALSTEMICNDKELLQSILPRAGSVSRPVSISTIQFLSTLIGAASMKECCRLVLAPDETPNDGNNNNNINSIENSPITPSKSLDIDVILNKVISAASVRFGSLPWIGRVTPQGLRENCSTNYLEAGLDKILSRLAGGLNCYGIEALSKIEPIMFQSNGNRPIGGPLLELTKKKLSIFLSLKYDEQVAVTGLVEKCVTVLGTLLVLSGSDPIGNIILKLYLGLFEAVSERVTELSNLLKSVPESTQKLEFIYAVLNDPIHCDPRYRRVIEKEQPQVIRMLETGLIVRELYREFEGSLLAIRQLRVVLINQNNQNIDDLTNNPQTPLSSTSSTFLHTPSSVQSQSQLQSSIIYTPQSNHSLSPFFSHHSPFSRVVHATMHRHENDINYDSFSESDNDDDDNDNNNNKNNNNNNNEDDGELIMSDEDLEESFLHECKLFEKDLEKIIHSDFDDNDNDNDDGDEEHEDEVLIHQNQQKLQLQPLKYNTNQDIH